MLALRQRVSLGHGEPDRSPFEVAPSPVEAVAAPPGYVRLEGGLLVPSVEAVGGVEPFFEDTFDGGQRHEFGGFTWSGGRNAAISDEIVYTGSHALKFSFGPTEPGGGSHWWTEQRFSLGQQMTEVWVEYMMYYPDGTEGVGSAAMCHRNNPDGPENNKFFRLWGGGHDAYGGNNSKVGMSTRLGSQPCYGNIFFEYTTDGSSGTGSGDINEPRPDWENDLGRWIQVRMYYRHVSAPSADDAHFILWKDGVVQINAQNVNQDYESQHPYWDSGYILGYDNSGFDETTFIYVDAIKFYDQDPGWSV